MFKALCYHVSAAPSEAPAGFEGKALSATEAFVWWLPLSQDSIARYQVSWSLKRAQSPFRLFKKPNVRNRLSQVKFWRNHEEDEGGAHTVTTFTTETNTRLEGMKPNSNYLVAIRACNTAGCGPPSERLMIRTKKARMGVCCSINEESLVKFEMT